MKRMRLCILRQAFVEDLHFHQLDRSWQRVVNRNAVPIQMSSFRRSTLPLCKSFHRAPSLHHYIYTSKSVFGACAFISFSLALRDSKHKQINGNVRRTKEMRIHIKLRQNISSYTVMGESG